MARSDEYDRSYAKINTLLNLYNKIYEIPYTYKNKDSMQDLCFLMNEIGLSLGDYCFGLYHSGPFSYILDDQIDECFREKTNEKEITKQNYTELGNFAIEGLRVLKYRIIKSNCTDLLKEKKDDIVYFMNAIAIAKYLIEYERQRDVLNTLNIMRDRKDVNEIAVGEARKLQRI